MNLYLLSQTVNTGYDTYDSCVVCAETEDEARMIHPGGYDEYSEKEGCFGQILVGGYFCKDWTWAYKLDDISVKLIGTADKSIQKGVICASFFNA